MKKILSILLPGTLVFSIIAIASIRYRGGSLSFFDIGFIFMYLLWTVRETIISLKDFSGSRESHTSFDRLTRECYAAGQFCAIISALWFAHPDRGISRAGITGMAATSIGICIRLFSIRYLGIHYSHKARLLEKHKVITSGPYSVIRHPAYLGMIIIHAGVTAAFFNYVTLCVVLLFFIPSLIIRIFAEDTMLMRLEEYRGYSLSRKRLIPFVW